MRDGRPALRRSAAVVRRRRPERRRRQRAGRRRDGVRHRRRRHRLGPVRRRARARSPRSSGWRCRSRRCAGHAEPAAGAASPSPASSRARSASLLGVLGIVLTVVLVRAIERFDDPGPVDVTRRSVRDRRRRRRASPRWPSRTAARRSATYTIEVDLGGAGHASGSSVDDVAARATGRRSRSRGEVPFGRRRRSAAIVVGRRPARRSASTPTLFESSGSTRVSRGGLARRWWRASRRRRGGRTCRRRATSSSWGPSSTRRPSSSTSTRSARAAVDRRWAMAIVVRPSARWARAREMRTSVSASTDDVASSSTSTSGSATPARSRATSWRSPADSCSPRSPTGVIRPSGSAVDPVADVEAGDDGLHVGDRRPRPGEADVGGDRVVEQERLLRHDDEPAAQLVVGDVVQRHAAEADLADRRVGEAGDQPAERRLARAGGADQGDLLAGRDVRRDVAQHGGVDLGRPRPASGTRT